VPADVTSGLFALPIGLVLLFGLAVLVLAEVFAHGLRLRPQIVDGPADSDLEGEGVAPVEPEEFEPH
jgi:hypothetical protein